MPGEVTPTVVVGLDALDARHLDRFADACPTLQGLRQRGVEAPLRSTFPPWTGSAWPSAYTGVAPSHHGVYGFVAYDGGYPDDAAVVDRTDVRAPALWNYATAAGEPAAVMNVPVTHPAEPIDGALVPGYLAPEDAPGHPPEVREDLAAAIGEPYRIYSEAELADDPDRKLEGYLALLETRAAATRALLADREWTLGFVQVQKTDAVFHNFDDPAAHRAVYAAADDVVAAVLEAAGDANVVVCSDHGIGPTTGYKVYLNEVLRRHGFVEATGDGADATLASRKAALVDGDGAETDGTDDAPAGAGDRGDLGTEALADDTGPGLAVRAVDAGLSAADALGVSPGDLYAAARRLGVAEPLRGALPDGVAAGATERVDWRRSRAYLRAGSELGVRVNLAGREPDGVVPRDDYEQVRTDLVDLLSTLETPDGDPVFEWVRRREAVHDGPHVADAPDVLVAPAGMNHVLATALVGRAFVPVDTHDHDHHGVLLAAGPDVDPECELGERSLLDVAPTAMAAAGLAVPERMQGTVPDGLLTRPHERADYGEVPYGEAESDRGDDDAVTDRLEDLGYL